MATITSNASGNWSAGATWVGGIKPADGDAVVIAAGHNVLMDDDLSAYTGLLAVTITGGATPGMLYFMNGTSGHLKIRTGYNLVGTTDTNRGRLLANSDGIWGNTGALAFANKAIIDLQGTSKIQALNLDIALYCTHPANWFVETYKTVYTCNQATDVNVDTDVLTFGTAPPAAGTPVRVKSSGTLPGGLSADRIYYTRIISGNTCKLALQNNDATIVDITSIGDGTLTMYDGHTNTATKILNVIQDITADAPWTTVAGHNRIVLADIAPEAYDQQRDTLATIAAGALTITTNNVDSVQFPCARIYLSSRNVSIRSNGTTKDQPIVDFTSAATHGGVFDCEIVNTYQPGTQTTFYGYGILYGSGHTLSGVITGCYRGIAYGSGHTLLGVITGCSYGIAYGSGHTISGVITGCLYGIAYGSGHTISGVITGCGYGIFYGSGHTISGVITGCYCGTFYGSGHTISEVITGCYYGIFYGLGHTLLGVITGCLYGIFYGSGHTLLGVITGCLYGIAYGSGHTISGEIKSNSYDYFFPFGLVTLIDNGQNTFVLHDRNLIGGIGRVSVENYGGVAGAYKAIDAFGDVLKTACNGVGDAPSVDPDGGNGYCIEASNIQSNCGAQNSPLVIFDKHRIWMTAVAHTVTYKVQTTYAGISAGNLKLTARYWNAGVLTEVTNEPAINQRTGPTDWTQTLTVTFTPTQADWVDFKIELMEYEAGNEVYIWPTPVIS